MPIRSVNSFASFRRPAGRGGCVSLIAALLAGVVAHAAPLERPPPPRSAAESQTRFLNFFRPLLTMNAALSPDGKRLAYAGRSGNTTVVQILEIDHPERLTANCVLGTDEDSTPGMTDDRERTPFRIRWMEWISPTRLVIDTNSVATVYQGTWSNSSGAIVAVDADGKNPKVLMTGRDARDFSAEASEDATQRLSNNLLNEPRADSPRFFRNPRIIDFDPSGPNRVLVRAGGNSRYMLYSLDAETGKQRDVYLEIGISGWSNLPDRSGRIGATIDLTTSASSPMRYLLEKRQGLLRWTALDDIGGKKNDPAIFSVSSDNFFGERAVPVGFDQRRTTVYFATNLGRDTYGLHAMNLQTGERKPVLSEDPNYDMVSPTIAGFPSLDNLVYDRYTRELAGIRYAAIRETTRWIRPEFAEVQATIEASLPGMSIEIQGWDQAENRFLATAQGPGDPGGIYVFDRSSAKLWEFARRSAELDATRAPQVIDFAFTRPDGLRLSGVGLIPRYARLRDVPVVFVCPSQPWDRGDLQFDPLMRVLTEMGFVAIQVNARGTSGFGRKLRESVRGQDWSQLQAEDLVATLDELARTFHIHTSRAAVIGRGLGGHLALRTAQLHPDRFRAAVALNPIVDIGNWLEEQRWTQKDATAQLLRGFFGDRDQLRLAPLMKDLASQKRPVFVLSFPGARGAPRTFTHLTAKAYASRLREQGGNVEFLELEPEFQRGLPEATAAVYRQIEDFLNTSVYDYGVQLGPLEERAGAEAPVKK